MRLLLDSDLEFCTELWNCYVGSDKFEIDEATLRRNTTASRYWIPQASFFADNSFLISKTARVGDYPGPESDWAHIHALIFENLVSGEKLLDHAIAELKNLGYRRIFYGQEVQHAFPGVPAEARDLFHLLESKGFTAGGECVDLTNDLRTYEAPPRTFDRVGDAQFRACRAEDIPALTEFFDREFPKRWKFDVLEKIETENRPEIVFAVFINDVCEGFALTQEEGCLAPIAGAVWNRALGPHWGALGPIGVSERVRGRGLGGAMLAFGLLGLKERGVHQCIIDWTTLIEFYGKHGFLPTRRYTPMSLTLAD